MPDLTLSFDNGPDEAVTPHVLDVLARHRIASTFFVIGSKLKQPAARKLSERAHAEGHRIGNHTYTHSVPLGERQDAAWAESEIGETQAVIGSLAHPDRLFRPFGGGGHLDRRLFSPAAVDLLTRGAYTCVLWSAIPRDWSDPDGWVERAVAQLQAQSWALMVLHDLPTGAMRHLDRFIGLAKDAGACFRQEFPPDTMPIVRGRIVRPLTPYIAEPKSAA